MVTGPALRYYWVAYYNDGTKLSQFDPITFKEYAFSDIDAAKLVKFALYPFTSQQAKNITAKGNLAISVPILPIIEINLSDGKRLIYYRDVYVSQEEYHFCRACNKEFYFGNNSKTTQSKYSSPICPYCGSHDIYKCKKCGKIFNIFEDARFGMCSCGGHLDRIRLTSGQYVREKRWIEYYVGYQTLVNGINHKVLLKINEQGDIELI